MSFFSLLTPTLVSISQLNFRKQKQFVLDSVFTPYRGYQKNFAHFPPIPTTLAQATVTIYLDYYQSPLTYLICSFLPIPKIYASVIFLKITLTLPHYKIIQ